jgi:cytoskeletal protein CcmA (bactofilin family)
MALWKEPPPASSPQSSPPPVTDLRPRSPEKDNAEQPLADATRRAKERAEPRAELKESLLAAELTIEGKIQGTGNVRIAGRFKGDVHVKGSVHIEPGAHLEGEVHANTVVVGGELTGNIQNAKHIDLMQSGVIIGDVKAGSLTVAAGSRMRGHVEFGWEEGQAAHSLQLGTGLGNKA